MHVRCAQFCKHQHCKQYTPLTTTTTTTSQKMQSERGDLQPNVLCFFGMWETVVDKPGHRVSCSVWFVLVVLAKLCAREICLRCGVSLESVSCCCSYSCCSCAPLPPLMFFQCPVYVSSFFHSPHFACSCDFFHFSFQAFFFFFLFHFFIFFISPSPEAANR